MVYRLPEAFFALSCSGAHGNQWAPNGHSDRVPVDESAEVLGNAVLQSLCRSGSPQQSEIRGAAMTRMLGRGVGVRGGRARVVDVSRVGDVITVGHPPGGQAVSGETAEQLGQRVGAALADIG